MKYCRQKPLKLLHIISEKEKRANSLEEGVSLSAYHRKTIRNSVNYIVFFKKDYFRFSALREKRNIRTTRINVARHHPFALVQKHLATDYVEQKDRKSVV